MTLLANIFRYCSVSILVHILEDLLQRSLLSHKFSERKTTIKVTVHLIKEIRYFFPKTIIRYIYKISKTQTLYMDVLHPDSLRTLCHSSFVSLPLLSYEQEK